MRYFLWKSKPEFWIYIALGLSGQKLVFSLQTQRSRNFLRFHNFIGFILWFFKKWGPVCKKWSYGSNGWIHLLGPSCPCVVSRPRAARSVSFLTFQNFIGFILCFLKKWGLACQYWSQGFGLMHGWIHLLGPSCPSLVSKPLAPSNKVNKFSNISKFYWIHLTILEKVWFANIRARGVLDLSGYLFWTEPVAEM